MATRPNDSFGVQPSDTTHAGASLREWFAGQALGGYATQFDPADAADRAVRAADALIARLNGATPPAPCAAVAPEFDDSLIELGHGPAAMAPMFTIDPDADLTPTVRRAR